MDDDELLKYFMERTDSRLEKMQESIDDLRAHKIYVLSQAKLMAIIFGGLTSTLVALIAAFLSGYFSRT